MSTVIPQRELRNHNAQIIERVRAGESFTVTRDGEPVADVIPHVATDKPPRFRSASRAVPRSRLTRDEVSAWMDDLGSGRDALDDHPEDPWERQRRRG